MNMWDKIPTGLKAAIFIGVLFIAPFFILAFWLAGTTGGIVAVLTVFVYFTVIYIVGVRRYMSEK
jgi:hypothetical protein